MKVLVLGWFRMRGTGKKSNAPYDFAQLLIANPVDVVSSEKLTKTGDGFEVANIDLRLGCEGEFKGVQFPAMLELKTENKVGRMGRMEVEVTGVVRPAKAA